MNGSCPPSGEFRRLVAVVELSNAEAATLKALGMSRICDEAAKARQSRNSNP